MNKHNLAEIITASLLETIDEKGKQDLDNWLNYSHANREFYESVKESLFSGENLSEFSNYNVATGWLRVKHRVERKRRKMLYKWAAAAAAAVVVGATTLLLIPGGESDHLVSITPIITDPLPKENYKALLILSEGDILDLTNEIELADGNIQNNDGVLTYLSQSVDIVQSEGDKMDILRVSRASEYKIVLSDGSTVHLNADSELRYPKNFGNDNRFVELSGEAYFEVTPDKERPFVVVKDDMKITVLGTSFNLKAYESENCQITLIQGRVRIEQNDDYMEIAPGQQVYESEGKLRVREVNVGDFLGWRDKRLIYKGAPLKEVMQDIARWYDKEVVFSDRLAEQLRLSANISKYENINTVLDIISQAVYVEITMIDDKIVIRKEI